MKTILFIAVISCVALSTVVAQPPPRLHSVIEKGVLNPRPATSKPPLANEVAITINGDQRVIRSNGVPNHNTGEFPGRGNPNRITAYFMTEEWPVVPRVFRGTPSSDFMHGPPNGGPGQGGRPSGTDRGGRGGRGPGERPEPGQVLPDFIRPTLDLSAEQVQKLGEIQTMVDEELKKILTPAQQQQLRSPDGPRQP